MTFDQRYRAWAPRSQDLFGLASRYIPGGADSSARTAAFGWRPYPLFLAGFVIIYSLATGSLNSVQIGFGFGLAAVGLVLSAVSKRVGRSSFYTDPTTSHGATADAELAGSQPT